MKIKLIPVIEITHYNQEVKFPEKGPYWEHPDDFERYSKECLIKAGFPDQMKSYANGSGFYELSEVSDKNLLLEIILWTDGYTIEEICPLYGGYVLNIDGINILFPQCCGDLSDIKRWKDIANGNDPYYWEGHPVPLISIKKDKVIFDLTVKEDDEYFVPPPPQNIIKIERTELVQAVNRAEQKLDAFSSRLKTINKKEKLGIADIENVLIYGR